VGLNAGWIGSFNNNITNTGTDTGGGGLGAALALGLIPGSIGNNYSGFLGGAQVGYNWQFGGIWLIGAEADFDGASAKNSTAAIFPGSAAIVPFATTFNGQLSWLSTVRGRFGLVAADQFLVYATGGLAYGQTKIGSAFICPGCAPPTSTEPSTANQTSNTSVGWTAGAGFEWLVAPNWSIKAEYLYVDLGNRNSTITYTYPANISTLTSSVRETENIVRAGINWHFGGPVGARY
jgi:outer membrane immunogenic protein